MNERNIFIEALDRNNPAERAAFLDGACGGDAALRQRVEILLRSYVHAQGFLEVPPNALVATIVGSVPEESGEVTLDFLQPSTKPGCLGTLGQYEVVEVVGRGGMGIVLRAYDTKLNRVVAIKAIAPELTTNALAVKRFLREAQAAAAVSHDHVITIHAIHDEARPPFIVMEYVAGPSLQEKIDRTGGLALKEILRIGMQTAAGLAAAHEQGLVHRDIKPANILLEHGIERVKITDFGLARAIDDNSITQPGLIAGTPQFMSPEQAQGRPVDHRSDLFSLGSVLYTMCTGRAPFKADTSVATLRKVADESPAPIRKANPDIPEWLAALIARLMAKDPSQRFESARAVSETLGKWLSYVQSPQTQPQPEWTAFRWNGFAATAPFIPPLVRSKSWLFSVLLVLHLLCIAAFAAAITIEVESVIVAGPVCSLLGLSLAIAAWTQARSIAGTALGVSTIAFSLFVTVLINLFEWGPAVAREPVSWLVLLYDLLALPVGMLTLASSRLQQPIPIRFRLGTLFLVMLVLAISIQGARLTLGILAGPTSILAAITSGVFVALVLSLVWVLVATEFQGGRLKTHSAPGSPAIGDLKRRNPWLIVVALGLGVAIAVVGCLQIWEYRRSNYGILVIESPSNAKIVIESLRHGQILSLYNTSLGTGYQWRVPTGYLELRIQGAEAANYRLVPPNVMIQNGSRVQVRVEPVESAPAAEPTAPAPTAWDESVTVAEGELKRVRTQHAAGIVTSVAVLQAEAGLVEVQIQQAKARKDQPQVTALLQQLVEVRKKELDQLREGVEAGQISQADLQPTRKALAEAQSELESQSAGPMKH